MTTEDYVSFETAKLLKEKGFDEVCEMFYCKPHEGYMRNRKCNEWRNNDLRENMTCTCPTIQMTMKWLREAHELHCDVGYDDMDWFWNIISVDKKAPAEDRPLLIKDGLAGYGTYEEACEAAIKYCLENLI